MANEKEVYEAIKNCVKEVGPITRNDLYLTRDEILCAIYNDLQNIKKMLEKLTKEKKDVSNITCK